MPYYKFLKDVSEDTLKRVVDGYIMFSRIPELNDYSETRAVIDEKEIKESAVRIRQNGLNASEIENMYMQARLLDKIFSTDAHTKRAELINQKKENYFSETASFEDLKNLLQDLIDKIQQKTGIFCISTKVKNFPMWAHYANNGKGFVVEYDNLDELFTGDDSGILNKLIKIDYYDGKRPAVTLSPSDLKELFFSKHKDWSYECEYRVVKSLSECKLKTNVENKEKHFFKAQNVAPERYVKRIIVGWTGDLEKIRNIVSKYNSKIPVVQAKVENGNIVIPQTPNNS